MVMNISIIVFFIYTVVEREREREKLNDWTFYPLDYSNNSTKEIERETLGFLILIFFFFVAEVLNLRAQAIMLKCNSTSTILSQTVIVILIDLTFDTHFFFYREKKYKSLRELPVFSKDLSAKKTHDIMYSK